MIDEKNLSLFVDFARAALRCGEPDPHLRIANWLAARSPEPAWVLGLYTTVYNIPSAEVLLYHLPHPAPLSLEAAQLLWPKIIVRKERRVNGFGPAKLAQTVTAYHAWLRAVDLPHVAPFDNFPDQFEFLRSRWLNYGRYFAMKLYEALRRTELTNLRPFSDVRPEGGRLSRRSLTLIYPHHDPAANDVFSCLEANELGGHLLNELGVRGVTADWFTLEVLLCNFRQALAGQQYPGRGHDSELDHLRTVEALNPEVSFRTLEARAALFPAWALGELSGWTGRRKLGHVMGAHGYVWSDARYDYPATVAFGDLARPMSRLPEPINPEETYEALPI
jgi:hypothetical protein